MRTVQTAYSLTLYADEDSDFGILVALSTAFNTRIYFDEDKKEYGLVLRRPE